MNGDWEKQNREVTKTQCPGCHGHLLLRMEKVSSDTAGNAKMEDRALSLRLSTHTQSLSFSLPVLHYVNECFTSSDDGEYFMS